LLFSISESFEIAPLFCVSDPNNQFISRMSVSPSGTLPRSIRAKLEGLNLISIAASRKVNLLMKRQFVSKSATRIFVFLFFPIVIVFVGLALGS